MNLCARVVADAVTDLKDPRIGFLTITGAETSPDLRHAVVYYSVLGSDEEKEGNSSCPQQCQIPNPGRPWTRDTYEVYARARVPGRSLDRRRIRITQILADLEEAEGEGDA